MTSRALATLACCAICAACGRKSDDAPAAPGNSIAASDRLAWDQQASDANEIAIIHYALYVDGVRSELGGATCSPAAQGSGFSCQAPVPVLNPGAHALELASFVSDVAVLESPKSPPLHVQVGSSASNSPADGDVDPRPESVFSRADGHPVATELVAHGLRELTDLAFAADGRMFVAQRTGELRTIRDGRLDADARVDDVDTRGGGGLLAMAVAPRFSETHHLFVLYTGTGRNDELVFRVARYREVNGTLGDRVILLDGIPAAPVQPRGILRFGPDGRLFVAFDDGGDEQASRDQSSYSGKLLRLNPDGSTARDQGSPIIGEGLRSPRGLDWSPINDKLWLADVGSDGEERLIAGSSSYVLTPSAGASGLAFSRGGLIVGGDDAMRWVRLSPASDQIESVESLSGAEGLTPIRAVAVSPSGVTYFLTDTLVGRLMP